MKKYMDINERYVKITKLEVRNGKFIIGSGTEINSIKFLRDITFLGTNFAGYSLATLKKLEIKNSTNIKYYFLNRQDFGIFVYQ